MRILGIDPALAITGYGAIDVDKNTLSLLEAGIIRTQGKDELPQRVKKIHKEISGLISDIRPDVMVLEKIYAHYRHPTTAYILGHARGVICLASAQAGIPLAEYAATRIKKAITGGGLASKYQIQRMVMNLLGLKEMPEYTDVSDALALAIAHSRIMRVKL